MWEFANHSEQVRSTTSSHARSIRFPRPYHDLTYKQCCNSYFFSFILFLKGNPWRHFVSHTYIISTFWDVQLKLLILIFDELNLLNHHHHSNSSCQLPARATKRPKITLPPFDGEILRWQPFWQAFKAEIDSDDALANINKAPWAPSGFKVSLSLVEYGVKNFF